MAGKPSRPARGAGRASGTGAVRAFRDNRAGLRTGAVPGSGIAGFAIAGFAGRGAPARPGRGQSGSSGIAGRGGAPARFPDPGLRDLRDAGRAGVRDGGGSGVPGQPGGAVGRRGSRFRDCGIRNCGICGTRGERASGMGAVRAFRDNRAGRRAGAVPGSGMRFPWERRRPRRPARSALAAVAKAGASTESRRPTGARRRAVIDDAGEDAGGPGEIGGAGSGHAHASRIAPSGFRETPRTDGSPGASGSPPH